MAHRSSPEVQQVKPLSVAPDRYTAIAARGIEPVTADQLRRLGAVEVQELTGGVSFRGSAEVLYRACLAVTTVSRIIKPIKEFAAANPEMLYSQTRRIPWEIYLNQHKTLAVYATIQGAGGRSKTVGGPKGSLSQIKSSREIRTNEKPGGINHSQYAALKVKDAIVDRLRHELGARPNVDTVNPDLRIHAYFASGRCTISLDATGDSLHERGYRIQSTAAPLKETLAAAVIELTQWNGDVPLFDPMCGSGTLVIEAARKAMGLLPGLDRTGFACHRWPDFEPATWQAVLNEAKSHVKRTLDQPIFASDSDANCIRAAEANAKQAGVAHLIRFEKRRIEDTRSMTSQPGVIVVNPPYGERIGKDEALGEFYGKIGQVWSEHFPGWTAFFLAGNLGLTRSLGLEASARFKLFNGPIDCRLLRFDLPPRIIQS